MEGIDNFIFFFFCFTNIYIQSVQEHDMNLESKCYNLALEELRTPGTYFYYQHRIDSIETVEQCKALLFIAQHDCNIVRNHHNTHHNTCEYSFSHI